MWCWRISCAASTAVIAAVAHTTFRLQISRIDMTIPFLVAAARSLQSGDTPGEPRSNDRRSRHPHHTSRPPAAVDFGQAVPTSARVISARMCGERPLLSRTTRAASTSLPGRAPTGNL
jgi:hypothetical protein